MHMHFNPLSCPTPTRKFRNGHVKSIEKQHSTGLRQVKSQWKCESQFSTRNECNSGRTWRAQLVLLYSCFSRFISFWLHTSLRISVGSTYKQKISWVLHLVTIHMQSICLLKLTVRLSLLYTFFCSLLSVRLGEFYCTAHRHYCLHRWQLLWKEFTLYIFDSDYPDTSLNRHYLTKWSSPDKRDLTLYCGKMTKVNLRDENILSRKIWRHKCQFQKYTKWYVDLRLNEKFGQKPF